MTDIAPIKLKGRVIKPHKAIIHPLFSSRTVLTNSPWDFVDLWLKRKKRGKAQFYWNQAREFHKASDGLPTQSAPLLHYYSFLNASKALLTSKGITFNEYHGIKSHNSRGAGQKINLTNEGIKIEPNGVFPSLATFLNEIERSRNHTLQELFFNLPYIHRTYCLTYPSQTEMFIPLSECHYVTNKKTKRAFLRAKLSKDFCRMTVVNRLPRAFALERNDRKEYTIRSNESVHFSKPERPTETDLKNLRKLHYDLRKDLYYINGVQTLWYVKSITSGPKRLSRFSMTITLGAMHRLSELCRYRPLEFESLLSGQKNWLLNEFIQQSPNQFIDEIASEITGHQFLVPNVRMAN